MAEDNKPWIAITIAIIGLVGSLGAAWLTAENKVNSTIEERQSTVAALGSEASDIEKQITAAREELARLRQDLELRFPSGAVVAFNLTKCPEGWLPLPEGEGRVIVGVGRGEGLTSRALGQTGGREHVLLTEAELPQHAHGLGGQTQFLANLRRPGGSVASNPQGGGGGWWEYADTTATMGQGKPYDNMPPFLVLRYCQRQ